MYRKAYEVVGAVGAGELLCVYCATREQREESPVFLDQTDEDSTCGQCGDRLGGGHRLMLIEMREPSGMVSRWGEDPTESFWAVVARMASKYHGATFRILRSR